MTAKTTSPAATLLPIRFRPADCSINGDVIRLLYASLGERAGEEAICRLCEDVARRLARCDRDFGAGDFEALAVTSRQLATLAENLGMVSLRDTARGLIASIRRRDANAVAATLGRLRREGDAGLIAVWDVDPPSECPGIR